jgi:ethanolamine utilization microcompartment shell protein EutL
VNIKRILGAAGFGAAAGLAMALLVPAPQAAIFGAAAAVIAYAAG